MKVKFSIDRRANSLYIRMGELGSSVDTEEVEDGVIVDRAEDGSVVGIEILYFEQRADELEDFDFEDGDFLRMSIDGKAVEFA